MVSDPTYLPPNPEQLRHTLDELLLILNGPDFPRAARQKLHFLTRFRQQVDNIADAHTFEVLDRLLAIYRSGLELLQLLNKFLADAGFNFDTLTQVSLADFINAYVHKYETNPEDPDLAKLTDTIHQFSMLTGYGKPKVNLDPAFGELIMHDVGHHITSQIGLMDNFADFIRQGFGDVVFEVLEDPTSKIGSITPASFVDAVTNFINYFSIMVALESRWPVTSVDFVDSLPSGVAIRFLQEFVHITPEDYTAFRTVVLNAIQYLRGLDPADLIAREIQVEILIGQSKQAVLDMFHASEQGAVFSQGTMAEDTPPDSKLVVITVSNKAYKDSAEKLAIQFQDYVDSYQETYAKQGLRLAVKMTKTALETPGSQRHVSAVWLAVTPIAGNDLVQEIQVMLVFPDIINR